MARNSFSSPIQLTQGLVLLAVLSGCSKPEPEPPLPTELPLDSEATYSGQRGGGLGSLEQVPSAVVWAARRGCRIQVLKDVPTWEAIDGENFGNANRRKQLNPRTIYVATKGDEPVLFAQVWWEEATADVLAHAAWSLGTHGSERNATSDGSANLPEGGHAEMSTMVREGDGWRIEIRAQTAVKIPLENQDFQSLITNVRSLSVGAESWEVSQSSGMQMELGLSLADAMAESLRTKGIAVELDKSTKRAKFTISATDSARGASATWTADEVSQIASRPFEYDGPQLGSLSSSDEAPIPVIEAMRWGCTILTVADLPNFVMGAGEAASHPFYVIEDRYEPKWVVEVKAQTGNAPIPGIDNSKPYSWTIYKIGRSVDVNMTDPSGASSSGSILWEATGRWKYASLTNTSRLQIQSRGGTTRAKTTSVITIDGNSWKLKKDFDVEQELQVPYHLTRSEVADAISEKGFSLRQFQSGGHAVAGRDESRKASGSVK